MTNPVQQDEIDITKIRIIGSRFYALVMLYLEQPGLEKRNSFEPVDIKIDDTNYIKAFVFEDTESSRPFFGIRFCDYKNEDVFIQWGFPAKVVERDGTTFFQLGRCIPSELDATSKPSTVYIEWLATVALTKLEDNICKLIAEYEKPVSPIVSSPIGFD